MTIFHYPKCLKKSSIFFRNVHRDKSAKYPVTQDDWFSLHVKLLHTSSLHFPRTLQIYNVSTHILQVDPYNSTTHNWTNSTARQVIKINRFYYPIFRVGYKIQKRKLYWNTEIIMSSISWHLTCRSMIPLHVTQCKHFMFRS